MWRWVTHVSSTCWCCWEHEWALRIIDKIDKNSLIYRSAYSLWRSTRGMQWKVALWQGTVHSILRALLVLLLFRQCFVQLIRLHNTHTNIRWCKRKQKKAINWHWERKDGRHASFVDLLPLGKSWYKPADNSISKISACSPIFHH